MLSLIPKSIICSDCSRITSHVWLRTVPGPTGSRIAQWHGCSAITAAPQLLLASPHRRACIVMGATRPGVENSELMVGDIVALVSFSLYKQIASIVTSPSFPGWLAPLSFNPDRWYEFVSFTCTLSASWLLAAALTGGLSYESSRDVPSALRAASWAWLVSMPVAAAQLVLVTALESRALVGTEDFATALPLTAQGPGEPVATAAGVLGVMCIWRAFYTVWIDPFSDSAQRLALEAQALREALMAAVALAAVGGAALQVAKALDVLSGAGSVDVI